jgi:hypothetical protein
MRTVAPALLAFYLLFGMPRSATAAGKIKIEIVEATTTIGTMYRTDPGSPEQIHTQCNSAGTDCNSTVIPAIDPSSSFVPEYLSFEIKAIFPDGSHVELMCFPSPLKVLNNRCGGITPSAGSPAAIQKKEKLDSLDFSDCVSKALVDFAKSVLAPDKTVTCTTKKLGIYEAKWEYDKNIERWTDHMKHDLRPVQDLVIYGPYGKVKYQVKGSW